MDSVFLNQKNATYVKLFINNNLSKELCWHSLDFKISDGNGDYDEMHFEGDTFADVLESFNNYRAEFYSRLGLVPHATFITTMREERCAK